MSLFIEFHLIQNFAPSNLNRGNPEREVRLRCRDIFRQTHLLERIIPSIEEMLAAGEIVPPEAAPEQVGPAIPEPKQLGDAGHRG